MLRLPTRDTIDLVNSNDKGSFTCLENFDTLKSLRFKASHSVHDEYGDVSDAPASTPKVSERFMSRGVHD